MKYLVYLFLFAVVITSCKDKEVIDPIVIPTEKDETPYQLQYEGLPPPMLPEDNTLTVQGVQLGRMLFYEKRLSGDGTQACASCHRQEHAFTDTARFSLGIAGLEGKRQAMSVFNMAWNTNGFFWDGRAHLLRDQSLLPIQDELEMDETLDNVIAKLTTDTMYTHQFIRAFGDDMITEERIALALEQFMMSIVSSDSKYDRWKRGQATLTESEERGRVLYETEYNPFFPEFSGADCAHCHGGANFENDKYMNNGLDPEGEFADLGLENVTGRVEDRAKFKVTSLRNIAVTAPYMHDGRFKTLREVVDHYNEGIHPSNSADEAIIATSQTGLFLTEQDKEDLINFLHALTDNTLLTKDAYRSPF